MKILVLGAAGMAGHTIALYFQQQGHQVWQRGGDEPVVDAVGVAAAGLLHRQRRHGGRERRVRTVATNGH